MLLLLELLFSLVRIAVLLLSVLLALILGDKVYNGINYFLVSFNFPCLGLISFLTIFVPPFALLYGAHIKKFFWQREAHYNAIILLVSFVIGAIISFLPIDIAFTMSQTTNLNCNPNLTLNAQLIHMLGTALITMFLAAIGMDLGVVIKHASHHIHHKHFAEKSKSKSKPKRKRK